MNTRKLGHNSPDLTEIGFGAWAIGGPWEYGWGSVDDEQSIDAIHKAFDFGINWIDTAAVYGLGHSEEIVGRALKGIRGKVFLATKCGMIWDEQKHVRISAAPKNIRTEIEDSLRRLQTDYIDLYQIHWPDPSIPVEDSWSSLVQLKEEGKVQFIGVCNYDVPLLEKCNRIHSVQSLLPPYNLLRRQIELEILPYCAAKSIGVVAYSPMQAGLLSGVFDVSKLAKDDWRRKNRLYQEPYISQVLNFVDRLRPLAAKFNVIVGQLAIAWVLHHTAITSAIVGARSPWQVEGNVGATAIKFQDTDIRSIEQALKECIPA